MDEAESDMDRKRSIYKIKVTKSIEDYLEKIFVEKKLSVVLYYKERMPNAFKVAANQPLFRKSKAHFSSVDCQYKEIE